MTRRTVADAVIVLAAVAAIAVYGWFNYWAASHYNGVDIATTIECPDGTQHVVDEPGTFYIDC